jgi:hypothetical protein
MYPYHNDQLGGEPREGPRSGALLDISNEIVRLYKEQFGRGPTHARTNWAGPDTLITTLENTLTRAERNLVAMGERWQRWPCSRPPRWRNLPTRL